MSKLTFVQLLWFPSYTNGHAKTEASESKWKDKEGREEVQAPMIVFLNSRNGQQSVELKKKFCRYLGPNQVFELTQGGPAPGLELFKNVPNLRVLACGYVMTHISRYTYSFFVIEVMAPLRGF